MDKVTVIQADRVSAVEMLRAMWRGEHGNVAYGWMRDEESATLSGKRDDLWAVQAFAKHRLATAPDSEKLREALTPSGDTKAAYHGEFKFDVMFPSLDEDDDEPVPHPVTVPWDTIKEIMAAIASRAGASL